MKPIENILGKCRSEFIAILASLLVITNCTIPGLGHSGSRIAVAGQVRDSVDCNTFTFRVNGLDLRKGKRIGKGADGEVFEVLKEGKPNYDWVLKTVSHHDLHHVKQIIRGELRLAEILPNYFTQTLYITIVPSESQNKYVGMMLKKRVNGSPLFDVSSGNVKELEQDYSTILEAFKIFRSGFIKEISHLGKRGIFITDFHADNIMYDHLEKRWYMIDANVYSSWEDFFETTDSLNTWNNRESWVPGVWSQIVRFPNGPPTDEPARGQFFEKYADIYLQPYFDSLRRKAGHK